MVANTKAAKAARTRANAAPRDSHGRFKTDHHIRNAAFAATAVVGVAAVGIAAAFKFGLLDRFLPETDGYDSEDLLVEGTEYRPDPLYGTHAFRPDVHDGTVGTIRDGLQPDPEAPVVRGINTATTVKA